MTLSSASVRNVMQDLEELGLIYAPHTSAGRLPTELGLRFFVDALLEFGDVPGEERQRIEAQVKAASQENTIEGALAEATSLLSGLTRGAGVVVTSKENSRLKHIEFVRLEPERALAILVGEDGTVENRVLPIPRDLPAIRAHRSRPITSTPAFAATRSRKFVPNHPLAPGCRGRTRCADRAARRCRPRKLGRACAATVSSSSYAARPICSKT